jgi:hypothetical protein
MQTRTETLAEFQRDTQEKKKNYEKWFWVLWLGACLIGWCFFKPLAWGILIPFARKIQLMWREDTAQRDLGEEELLTSSEKAMVYCFYGFILVAFVALCAFLYFFPKLSPFAVIGGIYFLVRAPKKLVIEAGVRTDQE